MQEEICLFEGLDFENSQNPKKNETKKPKLDIKTNIVHQLVYVQQNLLFNEAIDEDIEKIDKDAEEIDETCYSIQDTLGEIRSNLEAGAIIDAMMAKGVSERGDVAEVVKDNPALQKMMGRMKLISLLKQGGADEESIKQMNRILQGIKKTS